MNIDTLALSNFLVTIAVSFFLGYIFRMLEHFKFREPIKQEEPKQEEKKEEQQQEKEEEPKKERKLTDQEFEQLKKKLLGNEKNM